VAMKRSVVGGIQDSQRGRETQEEAKEKKGEAARRRRKKCYKNVGGK